MTPLFWACLAGMLGNLGLMGYWFCRRRWLLVAFIIPFVVMGFMGTSIQSRVSEYDRLIERAVAECKNAPKTVPYREGMTLCAGQSAVFTI